eukprot:1152185-Pelagomonas_calceolata.AAC.9
MPWSPDGSTHMCARAHTHTHTHRRGLLRESEQKAGGGGLGHQRGQTEETGTCWSRPQVTGRPGLKLLSEKAKVLPGQSAAGLKGGTAGAARGQQMGCVEGVGNKGVRRVLCCTAQVYQDTLQTPITEAKLDLPYAVLLRCASSPGMLYAGSYSSCVCVARRVCHHMLQPSALLPSCATQVLCRQAVNAPDSEGRPLRRSPASLSSTYLLCRWFIVLLTSHPTCDEPWSHPRAVQYCSMLAGRAPGVSWGSSRCPPSGEPDLLNPLLVTCRDRDHGRDLGEPDLLELLARDLPPPLVSFHYVCHLFTISHMQTAGQ